MINCYTLVHTNTPLCLILEPIWVIITVAEGGVLGVTQQLSRFGNDLVQTPLPQNIPNPFASPTKSASISDHSSSNAVFMSPNNSMVAQQGSPYISQLTPSPIRTQRPTGPGDPARSLFQVCSISLYCLCKFKVQLCQFI